MRTMTKLSSIVAAAAVAATGLVSAEVFAQGRATYKQPQEVEVMKTRAQVGAELAQARRSGYMQRWEEEYSQLRAAKVTETRAEVMAEVLATPFAERGALSREDGGSFDVDL